ncbi:MAG: hypothetical protein ACK4TF_04200 [Thermodesulfovibrionales bacterium]
MVEMIIKKLKTIKKLSREVVPVSRLKGKVIPSKKRKLFEKAMDKEV